MDSMNGQPEILEKDDATTVIVQAFREYGTAKSFKKSEFIFLENDHANAAFYVETGLVKISQSSHEGQGITLFLRYAGEIFGNAELLANLQRKRYAKCLVDCQIITLDARMFIELAKSDAEFAYSLAVIGARRLLQTQHVVETLTVYPAIAYKFEYKGKAVVISGDTIPVGNMVKYSKDIELLIHESYNKAWLDALIEKFPDQANSLSNPAKYHSTTLEVAEIARQAGVKHLVLTHHIPAPSATIEAEAEYSQGMQEIYKGKITMGRDLMAFEI